MAPSLTSADNGKIVQLKAGEEAALHLPENPSSGYRWALDGGDSAVARLDEQSFEPGSSALGAGGERQWTIRAAAPGSTTIRLKRWRPWEGEKSVAERYEVTVDVTP